MNLKINCVGDIMPGGVIHGKSRDEYISKELIETLHQSDLNIGTLECAIGNEPHFYSEKLIRSQDVIYAPDVDLKKLLDLNISCVSLANNHIFDLGEKGLQNTIKQLDILSIKHCGAGMNIEEASAPVLFEKKGKRIGILAFCDIEPSAVGFVPYATATQAGVNPMIECHLFGTIKELRSEVDILIVMLHWGKEHTFYPAPRLKRIAFKCIDAGCDIIVGDHSHRIQPIQFYKKRPIIYSLGNFLFPDRYLRSPRPMYYPDCDEVTSSFPVKDGYPWVLTPTLKTWVPLARIGLIATILIDDNHRYELKTLLVGIDEKSCLLPKKSLDSSYQKKYQRAGMLLKMPFYRTTMFLMKAIGRIKRFI